MVYNNVTNTLRKWCNEMTQRYSDEYQQARATTGQSMRFLPYIVTAELHYKLGILVDMDFPSYKAYLDAVTDLMSSLFQDFLSYITMYISTSFSRH